MSASPGILSRPSAVALAAVTAVLIAACSSGAASSAPAAPTASAVPSVAAASEPVASPAASPAGSAAGSVYEVDAATGSVGAFLTGEDGKTLYIFKKDSPGVSACVDACAKAWPPFILASGETVKAGAGVTGALATIKRADGSMQVTYKDAPLYYFASDTKAGDVTGQGVGGVWFVAAP